MLHEDNLRISILAVLRTHDKLSRITSVPSLSLSDIVQMIPFKTTLEDVHACMQVMQEEDEIDTQTNPVLVYLAADCPLYAHVPSGLATRYFALKGGARDTINGTLQKMKDRYRLEPVQSMKFDQPKWCVVGWFRPKDSTTIVPITYLTHGCFAMGREPGRPTDDRIY